MSATFAAREDRLGTGCFSWLTYPAPFASFVVRQVQPFDDKDKIGGNDTIRGGDRMDILYGQRGNDVLDAGEGCDEVYGGLGNDKSPLRASVR